MDIFIAILSKLALFTPVVVAIVSLINLLVALKVYNLNKKNSHSRLSIMPSRFKFDYMNGSPEIKITELTPNLGFEDEEFLYDLRFDESKGTIDAQYNNFKEEGFVIYDRHHEPFYWGIKMSNKSDLSAIDITLNYHVNIYKSSNTYNESGDILTTKEVLYRKISRKVEIPYLAAGEEKTFYFFDVHGEFPSAELFVDTFKSKERSFISKSVLIDKYRHPSLRDVYLDEHGNRILDEELLGASKYYEPR